MGCDDRPGPTLPALSLAGWLENDYFDVSLYYPCVIEYENKLYVGFSNNEGRRGNQNNAGIAIIPIVSLEGDKH